MLKKLSQERQTKKKDNTEKERKMHFYIPSYKVFYEGDDCFVVWHIQSKGLYS